MYMCFVDIVDFFFILFLVFLAGVLVVVVGLLLAFNMFTVPVVKTTCCAYDCALMVFHYMTLIALVCGLNLFPFKTASLLDC